MKHFLLLIVSAAWIMGCRSGSHAPTPESLTQQLVELDKAMGGATVTDKSKAEAFIKTSEELAALVEKTDEKRYVDVLLQAAGLAKTIEKHQKSIELYQTVADKFPNNPKAPTALFMVGFVYEDGLNDLAKAKSAYEAFLQKYPNDPDFADDAQTALQLLGKSPDEIVKGFNQSQQ